MLEAIVNLKELKKALKEVMVNRGSERALEWVDFNLSHGELEIRSTGTSTGIEVTGISDGYARVPLEIAQKVQNVLATFKKDAVVLKISNGRISIDSFALTHDEIRLRTDSAREIDVPVNARLVDLLLLAARHTKEQIQESGLESRVLEAQHELSKIVDSVVMTLQPLGVSREAVSEFVGQELRKRAKGAST